MPQKFNYEHQQIRSHTDFELWSDGDGVDPLLTMLLSGNKLELQNDYILQKKTLREQKVFCGKIGSSECRRCIMNNNMPGSLSSSIGSSRSNSASSDCAEPKDTIMNTGMWKTLVRFFIALTNIARH